MAIALKHKKAEAETAKALIRIQELAREQAERLGPYAAEARETATERLNQARQWTAPRLETAAHRVEDTVAPRVAEILTTAAHKMEPPPSRVMRRGRRVRRTVLFVGAGALAAVAVYGILRARQASADAEWQENLQQAREQVREAKEQVVAKAKEAQAKFTSADKTEPDENASGGEVTSDFNGRVPK